MNQNERQPKTYCCCNFCGLVIIDLVGLPPTRETIIKLFELHECRH